MVAILEVSMSNLFDKIKEKVVNYFKESVENNKPRLIESLGFERQQVKKVKTPKIIDKTISYLSKAPEKNQERLKEEYSQEKPTIIKGQEIPIKLTKGGIISNIGGTYTGVDPFGAVGAMKNVAKAGAAKVVEAVKELTPIEKVVEALRGAKVLRGEQEALYSAERSKRLASVIEVGKNVPGEVGFKTQLKTLKGELPKVEFENIREKLSQVDIDSLFNEVELNPGLIGFEKITAKGGLSKLFGQMGGNVPTEGELKLLSRVFPENFIKTVLDKRPLLKRISDAGYNLLNIPRSLMSSADLSAPLRQGLFLAPSYPKQWLSGFSKQFKYFGSQKAFDAAQENIRANPYYPIMQQSKLSLTDLGTILTEREERFMSNWAEKIPVAGKMVKASSRAYTGFLNKFRSDVFSSMVDNAKAAGLNPEANLALTESMAKFINSATGRGSLGTFQGAAKILNSVFFSPRLIASRVNLLNPVYYTNLQPVVRKQALKSLFAFAGAVSTAIGLAKLAGADVQTDSRSTDFLKIKIGNTRFDVMGGFQQYLVAASRLISGEAISSTTGKTITLGEGYKPLTRYDILGRMVESKEAPIASFITVLLKGQDFTGQKTAVKDEIASRFTPMVLQDLMELYKDNPAMVPLGALAAFGIGMQTYNAGKKELGTKTKLEPFGGGKLNNANTKLEPFK